MVQKFRAIEIEQLTEVSVLRDLQTADIIALQPHTRIHFYQKGDVVMTEGERLSPQLYTLLQGTLRLTRIGTSGKETLLRTLVPNEIFAAPALFMKNASDCSVKLKQLYLINEVGKLL